MTTSTTTYLTTLLAMRETTPLGAVVCPTDARDRVRSELASFSPEVITFALESVDRQLLSLVPLLEKKTPLIILTILAPLDQKMVNFLYEFSSSQAQVMLPGETERKTLHKGASTMLLLIDEELYELLPSELCPFIHTL